MMNSESFFLNCIPYMIVFDVKDIHCIYFIHNIIVK